MRKGKNNKHYKLSKLFSLLLILIMATTDVAPLVSVAVDTINEDKETVEEITGEEQELEKVEEEELEQVEEEELELVEEEELELVEPQHENMGISMMSMSTQSTPTYVMAKDSDFYFIEVSQNGYLVNGKYGYFRYKGNHEYVEIPSTIQGHVVNSYTLMFHDAPTTLKGVKSSNTRVRSMFGMFQNAKTTSLDLRQFDTSRITSMQGLFQGSSMKEVDISTWDTGKVSNMVYMFNNSHIENIDISHFDTRGVTSMLGMFRGSRAKTINIGNIYTGNVENMTSMFMNVQATSVDLSNLITSRVMNMSSMFEGAQIKHIDITSFDTSNVVNMSSMFRSSRADKITFGDINTKNVTTMEGMFEGVYIDALDLRKFDTTKVTTMSRMFRNTNIPKLDISSFNTSNVTNMSNMFRVHRGNTLDLRHFDTRKVTNMSGMFRELGVNEINLSSLDTSKVINMVEMFQDSKVDKIDLSNFNTMRVTDMRDMFYGTTASEINVSNFDTSYVTNMSNMFRNTRANKIDLGSFNMASVNDTSNMFQNTSTKVGDSRSQGDADKLNSSSNKPAGLTFEPKFGLAEDNDFIGTINGSFQYRGTEEFIEIPHEIRGVKVTSYRDMFANTGVKGVISTNTNVTDMRGMFRNTTSEELDISTIDTTNVTDMGQMFDGSKAIRLDLRNFKTENVTNMESMFRNTNVSEIDLGSFNLNKVTNTNNMFIGTKATIGYARTQGDLEKLKNSTGRPTGLRFSIWSIITQQTPEEWTKGNIDITINAISDTYGVDFVEMVNEPGRNLLVNSHREVGVGGRNEYVQYADLAPIFDKYGTDQVYSLSFELKSANTSNHNVISAYMQNGSSTKYNFVSQGVRVTEQYQRYEIEGLTPRLNNAGETKAMLSFFGTYRTGNYPIIRNVKVELGDKATPWTPAPEDSSSSGDQQDIFTVYNNGTYIFRATYGNGETRTIAHTVNNIDRVNPTSEITPSTTGQTAQDVTLYIKAEDGESGADYITLPDGARVNGNEAEFIAKENKSYTFKVTDKAGNTSENSYTVNNIDRSLIKLDIQTDKQTWTNKPINIKVTSEDSATPLKNIEVINNPIEGRNLHKGTSDKWTTWDMPSSIYYRRVGTDILLEEGKEYTYSIDVEKVSNDNVQIISEIGQGSLERPYTIDIRPDKGGGYRVMPLDGKRYIRNFSRLENTTSEQEYFAWGLRNTLKKTTVRYKEVKVELGNRATPWTPAPEDIKVINNSKTYPVVGNGLYTFKASYENGATSEVSVNVTNIDLDAPKLEVLNNPKDYTEDDEVELTIKATDDKSGVKSITLPDKTKITNKTTATYTVTENGKYEFIVEDILGNKETHVITVDKLLIPYFFYIYDSNNKPLQGAGFELLRDGIVHATATSNVNGLVDFGKVPPTGVYTIKQIKAPDGYIVDPEEKDVDVEDNTDPIEIINYPRGTEMPSTGTVEIIMITVIITGLITVIAYVNKKKKGYKK